MPRLHGDGARPLLASPRRPALGVLLALVVAAAGCRCDRGEPAPQQHRTQAAPRPAAPARPAPGGGEADAPAGGEAGGTEQRAVRRYALLLASVRDESVPKELRARLEESVPAARAELLQACGARRPAEECEALAREIDASPKAWESGARQ